MRMHAEWRWFVFTLNMVIRRDRVMSAVRLERSSVMYRQLILCTLWVLFCDIASAEVLKNGQSARDAINAMKAGGYEETTLDMGPRGKDQDIHFWIIDQGILIAEHSETNDEIASLRFLLEDERPKKYRQMFVFDVIAFDAETGEMRIRTRKPKPVPRKPSRNADNPFDSPPKKP